jgi:hypothetical protein
MKSWIRPPRRVLEATPAQIAASGAALGSYGGRDPIDGDTGYRAIGRGSREIPPWTLEKARTNSVAAYRINPMGTAVIDTIVAFAVGDSGVKWQATNPEVGDVVREFWDDPANCLGHRQELMLRSNLLLGEKLTELMQGKQSGVVRVAPIEPTLIKEVRLRSGNPLWPSHIVLPGQDAAGEDRVLTVAAVNDKTGLREGEAMFWAPWRTLDTDVRGQPFMASILDWLDNYDTVLSNMIDRTAIARYLVWDVTVEGGDAEVTKFITDRGGTHAPASGTVEVHNSAVKWEPKMAQSGAAEDIQANQTVLTNIASGSGLARTWLADPEGANRATSLSMAEPVRRRVGSVQNVWLYQMTELCRFAVDRAVAAGILPSTVDARDPRTGETTQIAASQAVTVTGPEIAAADSAITAQVLLNLSTGLEKLKGIGALSDEAVAMAGRKAWEDYMGVPFNAELAKPDAKPDDVSAYVSESGSKPLRVVGR